jgi:hypothetical protein
MDHGRNQVVGDQLAGGHAAPDLGAQLGVVLDVPAEDVADADVFELKGFGQELGVGAFPAALDAHDDVLAHPVTCLGAPELSVVSGELCQPRHSAPALRPPSCIEPTEPTGRLIRQPSAERVVGGSPQSVVVVHNRHRACGNHRRGR